MCMCDTGSTVNAALVVDLNNIENGITNTTFSVPLFHSLDQPWVAAPPFCDGIFKQSLRARKRLEIGLSYRPARLHRLTELIPWNRFLGPLKV
jgi:hypothetical protein